MTKTNQSNEEKQITTLKTFLNIPGGLTYSQLQEITGLSAETIDRFEKTGKLS